MKAHELRKTANEIVAKKTSEKMKLVLEYKEILIRHATYGAQRGDFDITYDASKSNYDLTLLPQVKTLLEEEGFEIEINEGISSYPQTGPSIHILLKW
jgi:hypothetical protein